MDKEAELKEFFDFIAGENSHEIKKADLIFSLENYALNLGEDVIKRIQEDIEKHKATTLNFEDFKNLWKHSVEKTQYSTRETAEQLFNLLLDMVYTNPLELKDKIGNDGVKKIISTLKIDWKSVTKSNKHKENDLENLIKDMVNSIDLDGDGKISLSDFEFMLKYFNESKNGHITTVGNTTTKNK